MKIQRFTIITLLIFLSSFVANSQNFDDFKGKIAYIGNDSNIYTVDFSTGDIYQLTDTGSSTLSYEFPTWSKDGGLAYFCCNVRGSQNYELSIHLSQDGISKGSLIYESDSERHVYAFWSPKMCALDSCVDLAVLIQDFNQPQLRVELFNSNDLETGQRNLGSGLPFYYSWSPTGESLILYRNNELFQYYSVETANIDLATDQQLGTFLSPSWSPVDSRILLALSTGDGKSQLAVLENGNTTIISEPLEGLISFSWSPDGKYVAYRFAQPNALSALFVIDSQTGEVISRSSVLGVLSFFWSPDSRKIAYITLADTLGSFDIRNRSLAVNKTYLTQSSEGVAWNILYIDDSSNILLNSFVPSIEMQYILNNFDQFAQSHSFWSPDSQYLVFSHYVDENFQEPLVSIINTANADLDVWKLVDGKLAIWSYR